MSELRDFTHRIEVLRRSLSSAGKQLDSSTKRAEISEAAESYFRDLASLIADADLRSVADASANYLFELRHKRGTTSRVASELKSLRSVLQRVELVGLQRPIHASTVNPVDDLIFRTLQQMVPAAAASYRQALIDLADNRRISWRGTATEIREALRETLDHLAPDAEVTTQPNFRLEPELKGPSMKQKVRFILAARGVSKSASAVPEDASSAVEAAFASLVRSLYTRGSVSTHTPTSKSEVERVLMWARAVFQELLELKG